MDIIIDPSKQKAPTPGSYESTHHRFVSMADCKHSSDIDRVFKATQEALDTLDIGMEYFARLGYLGEEAKSSIENKAPRSSELGVGCL